MNETDTPRLTLRVHWKILTSLWLILLVALSVRVFFAWNETRKIPREVLAVVPFQQEAGNIAFALSQGKGFSNPFRQDTGPTAWLTPVYPVLLSGIFRIFGPFTVSAFFAAVALNIAFSTATCVPIFYAGRRIGGLIAASLAAWLWAVFPNAFVIPFEWIWDTSLATLLAATILWSTLVLAESRRMLDWCAYGLLWGFSLLTNPALGLLLPFLFGWVALCARKTASIRPLQPALALFMVILCCLPWTIRNYSAFHRWIPLRSNFAFELWIGNNNLFDEHAGKPTDRITRYGEVRQYVQLGETAYMQQKWEKATEFIRTHPALELHLIGRRITATWLCTESPVRDFRAADSLFGRVVFLSNFLITLGTIAGIAVLLWKRSPFAFPLACFPLIFPTLYYATHTSLRYRHPADAALVILAAIAFLPRALSSTNTVQPQEKAAP